MEISQVILVILGIIVWVTGMAIIILSTTNKYGIIGLILSITPGISLFAYIALHTETEITPVKIKYDYTIDIHQDSVTIYTEMSDTTIPFNNLEEWIIRDNI